MKRIIAAILIALACIGGPLFFRVYYMSFLSDEEVIKIYRDNKELINSIKDGLFASEFVPRGGSDPHSIYLQYKDNQLLCLGDSKGKKMGQIQEVHDDAIEYFKRMKKKLRPNIHTNITFDVL